MIDWKRVAELREEIGAAEFDEVVILFMEEVETLIARMRAAPDPELFEENLHFLKGCAINLGFATFAGLCLTGETTSAAGDAHSVDLEPIFDCYEQSKRAFTLGIDAGLAA